MTLVLSDGEGIFRGGGVGCEAQEETGSNVHGRAMNKTHKDKESQKTELERHRSKRSYHSRSGWPMWGCRSFVSMNRKDVSKYIFAYQKESVHVLNDRVAVGGWLSSCIALKSCSADWLSDRLWAARWASSSRIALILCSAALLDDGWAAARWTPSNRVPLWWHSVALLDDRLAAAR